MQVSKYPLSKLLLLDDTMAHFSDVFNLKVDKKKNLIRLSVRDSENKIDEHWFLKSDVEPCLIFKDQEQWVGTGKLKIKKSNRDGLIAIDIDEDSRVIYKFDLTQIQILVAQLRGASKEIKFKRIRKSKSSSRQKQTASVAHESSISNRDLENLKNEILFEIKQLFLNNVVSQPAQIIKEEPKAKEDDKPKLAEPMFIPSDLVREDIKGNIKTKEQKSKSGDITDALKALKRRKKK
jgi:hypothetical protein